MAVLVAVAAVLGLVAGSYARAVADGFGADVDDHRKEARQAFARAIRIVPLPRRPYLIEGATAVAAGLVAWRLHDGWLLAPWLYAVVAGVALAVIDWRTFRLPDMITLPSYPIILALLLPSGHLTPAVISGLVLGGVYAVLWFVRPTGLGLGDVKLAGVIGLLTGALGSQAVIIAGLGGHILGAIYAVGLLVTRRANRTTEFPFGPFMLVAALVAVLTRV
jgi:leader peptidase (prepilin peptidase)/N-methyltransferase